MLLRPRRVPGWLAWVGSGRFRVDALVKSALTIVCAAALLGGSAGAQTIWGTSGADYRNDNALNSPVGPTQLNARTVVNLKVKWFYPTTGGISATPTVEPGGVYAVVQNGLIIKLDPATGALLWSHLLPSYVGGNGGAATTSPAIAADRVVVGINGFVIAIDKMTGNLLWATQVSEHPLAKVHASPVILNGHVYTGVASTEEYQVLSQAGYVPSFRGSAVSLNLATGAIEWKTYMVPPGYTGGGIWGSSPVADASRGLVYFTNGDNYTVPAAVGMCIRAAKTNMAAQRACLDPTDYTDSIIALNMATGAVVWVRATIGADAWLPLASCSDPSIFICPTVTKPMDVDFAQGPSLFYVHNFIGVPDDRAGTSNSWMLGAGQKTGVYWGLNPVNGGMFWATKMDDVTGELKWGSAIDTSTNTIFTALDNSSPALGNDLVGRNGVPIPNSKGGVWSALDAATGRLLFQIPGYGLALDLPTIPGNTPGGLSVTNGIIFAGATSGYMVAFDRTGFIHWAFNAGGVIAGSPAILNDTVFWGSGNYKPAIANQKTGLYAFSAN